MNDFKETFLSKLPSPIDRYASKTVAFAEWLQAIFTPITDLLKTIVSFREINNAGGKALDRIGDQFNQQRGEADDDFYRIMIRSKQATNTGTTTVNGLLDVISRSLNISKAGITIETLRHYVDGKLNDGEPLTLKISNIPLEWARSDFEQNYILDRIKNSVAAGVRVDEVSFVDSSSTTLNIRGIASSTLTYEIVGEEKNG